MSKLKLRAEKSLESSPQKTAPFYDTPIAWRVDVRTWRRPKKGKPKAKI
jgi:hypothetical protein